MSTYTYTGYQLTVLNARGNIEISTIMPSFWTVHSRHHGFESYCRHAKSCKNCSLNACIES